KVGSIRRPFAAPVSSESATPLPLRAHLRDTDRRHMASKVRMAAGIHARGAPSSPRPERIAAMANGFSATTTINRPIEEVFAFLADGENDKKFSSRVLEIHKTTDGPPGAGTVFKSTVKDAGMKSNREFELTELET